jgi:hypothetical protein
VRSTDGGQVDAAAAHARALQQQRSEAAEAAAAAAAAQAQQAQQAARAEAASSAAGVQAEADGAALQQELARWVQLAAAALSSSSPPPSSSTAVSVRPPQVHEPAELSKQLSSAKLGGALFLFWMDGW